MAAQSIPDWENLADDSKWIFESMARLGFSDFAELAIADQSLVLALALHLKNIARRAAEAYEA